MYRIGNNHRPRKDKAIVRPKNKVSEIINTKVITAFSNFLHLGLLSSKCPKAICPRRSTMATMVTSNQIVSVLHILIDG